MRGIRPLLIGVCCTYSLPVFAQENGASGLPPLSEAPQGPTVVIDDSPSPAPVLTTGPTPLAKDEPKEAPKKKNPLD